MPNKLPFTKEDYFKMLDSKLLQQPTQRASPEALRGLARKQPQRKMPRV